MNFTFLKWKSHRQNEDGGYWLNDINRIYGLLRTVIISGLLIITYYHIHELKVRLRQYLNIRPGLSFRYYLFKKERL